MKIDQLWEETLRNACGACPGDRLDDRQSKALTIFVLRQLTAKAKPHRHSRPETIQLFQNRKFLPDFYVPRKRRGAPAKETPVAKKPNNSEIPETEAPVAKKPNNSEIPETEAPVAKKPNTPEIKHPIENGLREERVTPATASPVAEKLDTSEIDPNPVEDGLKAKRVSPATKKVITFETDNLRVTPATAPPVARKLYTSEIGPPPMENGLKAKRVSPATKKFITFVTDDPIEIGLKQRRPAPRRAEEAVVTVLPLPDKFREAMTSMGMIDEDTIKFLVQRVLTITDVGKTQNRLQIPVKKIKSPDFLNAEEKRRVDSPEGMLVTVMEPSCEVCELRLRLWHMNKNKYYALVNKNHRSDDSPHKWHGLVTRNEIRPDRSLQVWSFRVGPASKLCLALVKV